MSTVERLFQSATRRGGASLTRFGEEVRDARFQAGTSQSVVGAAARMSGSKVSRIETGSFRSLSFIDAARVAAVVGLDLSVKTYPGGRRLRDAAHAERLQRVLGHVRPPLTSRVEVPLPATTDVPEQRAWDAVVASAGLRTASELEMRLHDAQAQARRLFLKRRDGSPDRFLLLIADTHANRRALNEMPALFGDLPRLRTSRVLAELRLGRHPPSGYILV
ncbi:MAG: helix-turn-helix domain-containing protein [Candidatus Limnocylindrales bacterium]